MVEIFENWIKIFVFFVLKALSTDIAGNTRIEYDGYEIRLLELMGSRLNFSFQVMEPEEISELGWEFQ